METTTVRINKDARRIIRDLSKRAGKKQTEWTSQAIYFLNETGFDIFETKTSKQKSVGDRIISFMKKREQIYFDPMSKYFLESKELMIKVLQGLENFGIVELLEREEKIEQEKAKLKTLAPSNIEANNSKEKAKVKTEKLTEKTDENTIKIVNDLRLENERLKSANSIYIKELEYLLKNIKPAGALSSSKYIINIISSDITRIKKLISE